MIWSFMRNTPATGSLNQPVLFITYDGLLDPLGGSQILPYLYSIAGHPRQLHIVSFEKPGRFERGKSALRDELGKRDIGWTPLTFTSRMGKLGKAWDLLKMYATALRLQRRYRFDIAHCRSYPAMQVGCFLRRFTGVKTIFDMRGLWVDDRVEGNLWPQERWLYRQLYRYYKRLERRLLECADAVVVLTERVVPEIRRLAPGSPRYGDSLLCGFRSFFRGIDPGQTGDACQSWYRQGRPGFLLSRVTGYRLFA